MAFRLAQISDTHLSRDKPFFVDNFRRIGGALRQARPDLVLNTGDISLDGASNESDLAAARALHDELGLPVRYLAGNHDLGDNPDCQRSGEPAIDESRRARYLAHFGPDFWTLDVPGWRLLAVNAQLLASGLSASRAQDEAVAEAVAGLGGRSLALLIHKPLFDQAAGETEVTGRFLPPGPRHVLLGLLGGVRPALVVCGHVHQFRETSPEGSRHVWGPSTGFVIPDRVQPRYGLKEVGWVEHRLEPDGRNASRLMRVPGVPTLDIGDFPQVYGPI
jgi:predicted MPP superfamily phosphohydrolase